MMRIPFAALASGSALVVVILALLAVTPFAGATPPGRDGRIVYMARDHAGHWQVWVANSKLKGATQLTHGHYRSGWAVWSPNGKWIAFDSNRTGNPPHNSKQVNDIFVMRPDGSGVKKLTASKGWSADAAWSPNGRLIAFDSDRGNRKGLHAIYVMSANGRKIKRITRPAPPLDDYAPRFSPDGTHLVFTRAQGLRENAPAALFTVRLDGSSLHRLTSFRLHAEAPDWSPDGKQIVFDAYSKSGYQDIYVVDATGGRPVDLTPDSYGQETPVWSPDGRKILFLDNRFVNGVGRTGLATMNPDGSKRHFLSGKNIDAPEPDWQSIR